jgi:hypothetical protein
MIDCHPTQEIKFKEVANFIFASDVLSTSSCGEILAELDDGAQWEVAKVATSKLTNSGVSEIIGSIDISKRDAKRILIAQADGLAKTKIHLDFIQRCVMGFVSDEVGLKFSKCGDAEIVRYSIGGKFIPHTDAHRDNAHRAFTVILYLNDDFVGGETCFPDQNYCYTPRTGSVVIFSPSQIHASMPILTGEKNIIVFWVYFPGSQKDERNLSV